MNDKLSEVDSETQCIPDHPGFLGVCLNLWVL